MSRRVGSRHRAILWAAIGAVAVAALVVVVALGVGRPGASTSPPPTSQPSTSPPGTPVTVGLGSRPPMGWNSWNHFGCDVDADLVERTADAMAADGMQKLGYTAVDIDDCWMAPQRDPHTGELVADPVKFPQGMAAVADYVHARGFTFGLYEDAGTQTCAGFPGSLGHERLDARTFARWGVDTLKYDNCNHAGLSTTAQYMARYRAMSEALRATGRPIFLAICAWGVNHPWTWGRGIGQSWRTTHDIADSYASMLAIFRQNVRLAAYAGPGGWNDPDMLEIGNGGMTPIEQRTELTLWAEMAAPLIAGADIRTLTPDALAIYSNAAAIAIDQDARGAQAVPVSQDGRRAGAGGLWVLSKPLADGGRAVALFNATDSTQTMTTTASAVGLHGSTFEVRDVWTGRRAATSAEITAVLAAHQAAFVRITAHD